MGLLDQLAGQLLGAQSASAQGGLDVAQIALQLLQQPGGLSGLLQQFTASGLGEQVQSWLGSGANLPISGEQLSHALGGDTVAQLAAQLGMEPGAAATALAQVLPQLIDKATPDGDPQAANALLSQGGDLLGKLFG